jgi:hypothetical protein
MTPPVVPSYVHVVASVDLDDARGEILYVNPSNVRSGDPEARGDGEVLLVLRDAGGASLGELRPQVRLEACQDEDTPRIGLIQQDVGMVEGLASIDLMMGGRTLDSFTPGAIPAAAPLEFGLGPPTGPRENRVALESMAAPRAGVSYTVQAKPDNDARWVTLAIGRAEPKFEIDKDQFPGAKTLDIKVTESTGFSQTTVQERKMSLEDNN